MLNIYRQQDSPTINSESKKGLPESTGENYKKFIDATGEFDSKELEYGLWFVKHKVFFYKLGIVFLVALNFIFWTLTLYKGYFLVINLLDNKKFEKELSYFSNYAVINERFAPKPLQILSTSIFQGGSNKYDFVSEVINPNERFIVTFSYYYFIDGVSTTPHYATLIPGQKALLASLGQNANAGTTGSLVLKIDNHKWMRIPTREVTDTATWQRERLNFEISGLNYQTDYQNGLKANQITFKLKNNSPFGYKHPNFLLGLLMNDALVGVIPLQTEDFRSMEEKNIDIRNFSPNLQINSIQVFPLMNPYEESVFLSPEE